MNNEQRTWRIEFARNGFEKLNSLENLKCAFIGGSVARDLADEFSDLEIGFVWKKPASEQERRIIIAAFDGIPFTNWKNWDEKTNAVEDNIYSNGFQIDLCHVTVANSIENLDSVLKRFDFTTAMQEFICIGMI